VLLTDREAEHLPGCNMAYRRSSLEAVDGFDPQFRIAGDDVDLCWRLQTRFGANTLRFHPGAMVWHHRRQTVAAYWRQQLQYGRAEAMLERKWPEKYNAVGHLTWNGRLYGKGFWQMFRSSQRRIYHGSWGTALFQSVYSVGPGKLTALLMMPEWYLLMAPMALVSLFSAFYSPLRFSALLLAAVFLPPALHAVASAFRTVFRISPRQRLQRARHASLTALLHFLQPAARLTGRFRQGLTPWRLRGADRIISPHSRTVAIWSETHWRSSEERLKALETLMRRSGAVVVRGGDFDNWDLEVRGGLLGNARTALVIEEHGEGRQLVRVRVWPMALPAALLMVPLFAGFAMVAATDMAWTAWALLNTPALLLLGRTFYEAGTAMAVIVNAIPAALGPGEKIMKS
jgi:hypothetical protein